MLDLTIVSTRIDSLRGALEGQLPADVNARFFSGNDDVSAAALQAEVALGAPDVLAPLLPQMPNLRWVQSTWAGVTPFVEGPRQDYQLTGVKGIFGASMSEYALGWLLALKRAIPAHAAARHWGPQPEASLGTLQLGIAGAGSIGMAVAQRCAPFVAKVRGLNSDGRSVAGFDECYALTDRQRFAAGLDALVMLLPDTPATDRLVDAEMLAALAPGAVLINGGRGNSLDVSAVVAALETQHLSAAVLDVLDTEPLPPGDALWSVPGLYITSHTAAPTEMTAIADVFLANLARYRRGQPLEGLIDFHRGY